MIEKTKLVLAYYNKNKSCLLFYSHHGRLEVAGAAAAGVAANVCRQSLHMQRLHVSVCCSQSVCVC